ncbi:hypothetical protein BOTNAR_0095g00150 [Botryotinia narcissicola]|uniref:Uncharacterized protein n=1 Tax=Botryotinia narcissicola TaxID=278944 RepID=A0A4Z1J4L9_9HELO|nr:hypothetical protein BOTNAR_0095g00150 [Botryotinia narcissicola]
MPVEKSRPCTGRCTDIRSRIVPSMTMCITAIGSMNERRYRSHACEGDSIGVVFRGSGPDKNATLLGPSEITSSDGSCILKLDT